MAKIKVANPVVEMDGDEMTRIIWQLIKDKLIHPYLDINLLYYDLSVQKRDETDDQITIDAANKTKEVGVAVKCATITPDEARVKEFNLKKMWRSPNGTIRNIIGGVIFREPIICKNVPRLVPGWTQPIVIGRHAYGDQYRATDFTRSGKSQAHAQLRHARGQQGRARSVRVPRLRRRAVDVQPRRLDPRFRHGLVQLRPVARLSASISRPRTPSSKSMTAASRTSSRRCSTMSSRTKFAEKKLTYEHRLIDDMVAAAMKWSGGYVWACKNYDGDVQSDIVAQGFGSLGLMTSVLMTPDGKIVEVGSRARHRDAPLPRASEGQGDLDQLDRLDLRLDARPRPSRQARQQRRPGEIRQHAGESLRRHGRGRLHDQGSRACWSAPTRSGSRPPDSSTRSMTI